MKNSICFYLLLLLSSPIAFSQPEPLKADAGPDRIGCINLYGIDTAIIGGNPSANGGTGQYTYCWETKHETYRNSNEFEYASSFLYDTTSANPKVRPTESRIGFRLTITDSAGNQASDSVYVFYSYFTYYGAIEYYYIVSGGSALLDYETFFYPLLPLDSISWSPEDGLSNPHAAETWASPHKDTPYSVFLRDTAGCFSKIDSAWYVLVSSPISEQNIGKKDFLYYDNTAGGIRFSSEIQIGESCFIRICDLQGKVLLEQEVNNEFIPLEIDVPQVIMYAIFREGRLRNEGKLFIK